MSSHVGADSDREASEDSSGSSTYVRPNKWHGAASTWRAYTQDETMLAASLVRLRDQDLSAHLFNAHAMKQRLYDPEIFPKLDSWAPKDLWRRKSDPGNVDDGSDFVPPKSWTAWPLLPEFVPRTREQVGPEDGREEYTFRSLQIQKPSTEVEDILIGVTLSYAKETFEARLRETSIERQAREWAAPDESNAPTKDVKVDQQSVVKGEAVRDEIEADPREGDIGLPARSKEHESQDPLSTTSEDSLDKSSRSDDADRTRDSIPDSMDDSSDDISGSHDAPSIKLKSVQSRDEQAKSEHVTHGPPETLETSPQVESTEFPEGFGEPQTPSLRAVVSADDERSARLLHPTIRHTLSKLDELLMALHHARQTCLNYASDASDAQNETDTASQAESQGDLGSEESPQPPHTQKRSRGRPRKEIDLNIISSEKDDEEPPEKKSGRGRKRHIHEPLEGESHEEMLFRVARLQKKPLPFTSSSPSVSRSRSRSRRSTSRKRRGSVESMSKRLRRLGTRDWSEIIGTAALVGFPQEAVKRAAQRCATLFGEGMTMRSFIETVGPENYQEDIIEFVPEPIPDLEDMAEDTDGLIHNTRQSKLFGRRKPKRRTSEDDILMDDRPVSSESGTNADFRCPFKDCARYLEGFSKKAHLISHLRRAHELTEEKAKRVVEGGEEMDGAVHADGFLKPLAQMGRGLDSHPRFRARSGSRGIKTDQSNDEKMNSDSSYDGYSEDNPEN